MNIIPVIALAIFAVFFFVLLLPFIIAPIIGGIRARKYIKRGEEAIKSKEYREAIKAYQIAHSIAPRDPDIPYVLGGLYIAVGDYAKAAEYSRYAISRDDQSSYPFFNLASAYQKMGDKENLKERCKEYLERFSDVESEEDVNLVKQWLEEAETA